MSRLARKSRQNDCPEVRAKPAGSILLGLLDLFSGISLNHRSGWGGFLLTSDNRYYVK